MAKERLIDDKTVALLESRDLDIRGLMGGLFGGNRRSAYYGSSMEFADYRPYIPGDDPRRIDWNLYGRTDKLYLKLFTDERRQHHRIYIDGSASMSIVNDGKSNFERAIEEAKKYVELAPRNTSFAVIIGGPVPQVMNPVPIADKRVILSTLDRLYIANGTMQIAGNLTAAAVTLAAGHNAVKQIVIVGDGQTVGWQLEDKERWKTIGRVFSSLKTQPIVTWRTLPLPTSMRNLAVGAVRPSRDIVGTDREVNLQVTVVNAGTEAVTPKGVSLTAEGEVKKAHDLRQLEPGESQTFTFTHRFKKPGGTIVSAKVDSGDDLPADDVYKYAMPVLDSLRVLLVEGSPGAPLMKRSATYTGLALRPEMAALTGEAQGREFLLETIVEDVTTAGRRRGFGGFSAVVLAGVRRLSDETRDALARFVSLGGGLLVMPSPGMDGKFFDEWEFEGRKVLPAPFGKWRENESPLDPDAFREMFTKFRTGTDLGSATPERVLGFGEGWSSNAVVVAAWWSRRLLSSTWLRVSSRSAGSCRWCTSLPTLLRVLRLSRSTSAPQKGLPCLSRAARPGPRCPESRASWGTTSRRSAASASQSRASTRTSRSTGAAAGRCRKSPTTTGPRAGAA